jgi:hypothetical protein
MHVYPRLLIIAHIVTLIRRFAYMSHANVKAHAQAYANACDDAEGGHPYARMTA